MGAQHRILNGKARTLGGGKKPWRAKLDGPGGRYTRYRVMFKEENPETGVWAWTSRTPEAHTEDSARALFAATEAYLDGKTDHAPTRQRVQATRDIDALGELMLAESRRHLAVRTVEGRECILRAHINPAIGAVPTSKWRLEHTEKVLERAKLTVKSTSRLSDIRTVMSVMRGIAHREGWLDRSVNPLDGLKQTKRQAMHGAGKGFVAVELRPDRHMVDAVARAADHLVAVGHGSFERFPLLGLKYRVAGYGGLRLGEQNGLRVWDIYFDQGHVLVNGSWTQPRAKDSVPFRGPVKNGRVHEVPLPASVMRALLVRAKELLGLPVAATLQQVTNAQNRERARRGRLAESPDRWWEVDVDPVDEAWVFVDTTTGLPTRSETHNLYWHKVRRWVSANDAEHEWPDFIEYRNMRHHAATFWKNDLEDSEWEDVASWLGDELTTVLNHYVRSGAGALKKAVAQLAEY